MNRFAFLERKRVEDAETDAETETAADVLAFGCFRAELEGGLAADFFLRAAEAESAWLADLFFELTLDPWI